ncbi:MAG: SLC13 family permease, partial [Deltaproteobacteria bacterium]|nr:SLC13 family permease [Deltaproteobacteria bacterium]
ISRKTGVPPSRLFMPLSFGAILGGTMTLVGTPPNILVADLLRARGLEPFSLFDFTPLGAILLGTGIVYMVTVGRFLLPRRDISRDSPRSEDLPNVYHLRRTLFSIRVPPGSPIDGLTLGASHFGSALDVQVAGVVRDGQTRLAPGADTVLRGGDTLLVEGRFDHVQELFRVQGVEIGDPDPDVLMDAEGHIAGVFATVTSGSPLAGKTLKDLHFRRRFGAVVVEIQRGDELLDGNLGNVPLREGDEMLALGTRSHLDAMTPTEGLEVGSVDASRIRALRGRMFLLKVHAGSGLVGTRIGESHLRELVGLTVAGIIRGGEMLLTVEPRLKIRAEDQLLVTGEHDRIRDLQAIGDVQLKQEVTAAGLESDDIGIVEVTLSPRSRAAGKTLAEIDFRDKQGLQVLSIWRRGRAIHTNLGSEPLKIGDAFLVQGEWKRIRHLGSNPDFVVLSTAAQEVRRTSRAPAAVGALLVMIAMVVTGFQPIHVAAFTAATLVVLLGAITMEEAYRNVEWKAVFLVAAILPVGIALERTGAARLVSDGVISLAGSYGSHAALTGLVFLSSALSQCLDGAPAVVIMAPVVLQAAEELVLNPHTLMMAVGLAASAAFMTPFSHKANLIVMGPGGYRVMDYLRVGTPLTIILLVLLVLLAPVFFPLS